MARVKRSDDNSGSVALAEPPETQGQAPKKFLPDGHPNAGFYPKDAEGFEQFQCALDEKGLWGDYFGKLYRVFPKRNANDKNTRVCKFASTLTVEEIEKKYGGRKWSVYLSRRVGTREQMVGVFQFDIEAKPIYQDDEGAGDPITEKAATTQTEQANTQIMGLLERLLTDALKQRDKAAEEGKPYNPGDAVKAALEMQKDAATQAIALVRDQSKGEGGGMMTMLASLIEKLLEKKESPLESKLLDRLLDRAFGDGEAKADPLDQLTKIMAIAEQIKGGGRGGNDWAGVATAFIQNNPGFLKEAKELIQGLVESRRGIQAPSIAGARPAPPVALPPGQPPAAPGVGNLPGNQPPANGTSGELSPELASVVIQNRVKQMLVEKLYAGEQGDTAAEVADAMHSPFAEHLALVLKTDPKQLMSDDILKRAITHPNCEAFCKEYMSYFEEEGAEPPAGDSPAPIPKAVN